MDLSLVIIALPILVMLASLVYVWIQIVSPGSVLFRQVRIGKGGKRFTIYKFRSMKHEATTHLHEAHVERRIRSNEPMTKLDLSGDPRLIKGGCFIRQAGLDELPQLINVLKGEMSLTGPRPCLPSEVKFYGDNQLRRFQVLPGLTGSWQVRRKETTTFLEMITMDDDYVEQLSPMADLTIILKTPIALLGQMRHCAKARVRESGAHRGRARTASAVPSPSYRIVMTRTQKISD